ncbi:MAG TPA: glucose 1-dehydrogenase [Ilumatobacteraceae bacterium]|nr:glucose 1-dehydrogenase [Ilumatobacteraceae bacterium]
MSNPLAGKVAVITGSGDGIGAAIARRLASDGATVIVSDVNDTNGEAVAAQINASGGRAVYQHADVTAKADNIALIQRAVDEFGSIDILVNNAWGGGAAAFGAVHQKDDATLEHGMAMNYYGPFWAMQAAFPHMYANGWGRVVNICSLNGVNAHMGTLEYNASKEALRTMTRTAAREWAATGITCNVICPGAKTASFRNFEKHNPEMAAATLAVHPMKRMGDPDADIAPVASFLCSDESRYVTGNTLYVDGGGHINGVSWAPELTL